MISIKIIQSIDVYFFSLFLLVLISLKSLRFSSGKTPQARLFSILIVLTFLIIIADCLSVLFDGRPGTPMRILLMTSAMFGYCLQLLICLFWFRYAWTVIFAERKTTFVTDATQGLPAVICLVIAIFSIKTGWLFNVDSNNVYHRGPLFALVPGVSFLYLLAGYFMIFRYGKNLDRRHRFALMSFTIPPAIGGTIQSLLYGVSLLWPFMTFSLLIIYMSIQNELMLLDYQTGINNRRSFDLELRRRIANAKNSPYFGLMLMDIDGFRSINDRYGHLECDRLLKTFTGILVDCFRNDGFVARIDGDEFAVILKLRALTDLTAAKQMLTARVEEWNENKKVPWELSVSIGCAPYIASDKMNQDHFLVQVGRMLSLDRLIPGDRRFRQHHRNI